MVQFAASARRETDSEEGMRWDDIDKQVCSVARALSVVGERWTMLILARCVSGYSSFRSVPE